MRRFAHGCLTVIVTVLLAGGSLTACERGSPARSEAWRPAGCWFHSDTNLRIECG